MKILKPFLLFICLTPFSALATSFSFSPERVTAPPASPFVVDVLLDSQDQSINAVDGELNFPADKLELQDIRLNNSLINFWLKSPEEIEPGRITFAGIIPGGFSGVLSPFYQGGRPGKIFSLVFSSKQIGDTKVEWQSPSALLNDGTGQATEVTAEALQISVRTGVSNSSPASDPAKTDKIPPEIFTPEISRDPNLFSGRWFVVFATRDNESGLAGYEVQEGDNNWREAESPYLLRDQGRSSSVSVRARDRAGNERVVTLSPAPEANHYPPSSFWFIILLCFVALFSFSYFSRRR